MAGPYLSHLTQTEKLPFCLPLRKTNNVYDKHNNVYDNENDCLLSSLWGKSEIQAQIPFPITLHNCIGQD